MYKNGKKYESFYRFGKLYEKGFHNGKQILGAVTKYRYIRDYLNGNSVNSGNIWVEIMAFSGGQNVALNKSVISNPVNSDYSTSVIVNNNSADSQEFFYSGNAGLSYVQIDLGAEYAIESLKIWHYYDDGRTYHNSKTEVSADGVNWVTVFDSAVSGEYPETAAGHEIIL